MSQNRGNLLVGSNWRSNISRKQIIFSEKRKLKKRGHEKSRTAGRQREGFAFLMGGLMGVGERQNRSLNDEIEATENKSFLFMVLLMLILLQRFLKVDICINKSFMSKKVIFHVQPIGKKNKQRI